MNDLLKSPWIAPSLTIPETILFEQETLSDETTTLVDQLLVLDKMVAKLKEHPAFALHAEALKRVGALATTMDEQAAAHGKDASGATIEAKGIRGYLQWSAKENRRSVPDNKALLLVMGEDQFVQLANVKLTDIDKYLTKEEQEGVVISERTGPRKLSIIHTTKGS